MFLFLRISSTVSWRGTVLEVSFEGQASCPCLCFCAFLVCARFNLSLDHPALQRVRSKQSSVFSFLGGGAKQRVSMLQLPEAANGVCPAKQICSQLMSLHPFLGVFVDLASGPELLQPGRFCFWALQQLRHIVSHEAPLPAKCLIQQHPSLRRRIIDLYPTLASFWPCEHLGFHLVLP